ncbi:pyridoxal-phosphate-dependent aminotransferase family protein [Paenirhodobacter populi]|uniref:Alanine--glyoxylate aminotransferase family protein n=1 Tax=Paenirhodobacter populi TaxID=2306993 RepID=A0A443J2G9_9RHOB|nr:aminotransferase class V-fold PLP-dependent enzyme [Sinirhodobacter populi]RWR14758.1 alanine--glyoxylate aminotransferase family protein [Sinirhodobacter populi]
MNLSQGRPYLAIPGPSAMPDRVLAAMHRPAPNIYEGDLVTLTERVAADLKRVALSTQHVAIYIANGHGLWEAAIANLFSRGDRALSLATGRFGVNWALHAGDMGVEAEMIDFGLKSPVDPARVEAALRADTERRIKVVLLTHVDTATGVKNDVPAVRAAIDAAGHPALLAVDCIASLGCDEFRFDDWGVDIMVAASQKGLMVPPGVGFVWFSERARRATPAPDLRTPYWDWTPRAFPEAFYQYFGGTAPTHHLFGLSESLKMILDEEGLDHVWARHETLARAVWAAFDAWGAGGDITLNIADPAARGHSVTAARIGAGGAGRLRKWCETEAGVTLGIGLGMAEPGTPQEGDFLRVAHMGHVNAHMTLGALAVMETGMRALAIPHGDGALNAATAVCAGR